MAFRPAVLENNVCPKLTCEKATIGNKEYVFITDSVHFIKKSRLIILIHTI